ncbi:GFA family protein [Marilutibacter chinensis]|uniref:GFA family protein n=1 Tax=Marilutibacter chinensis TaxID=2912247 RepID=A0ABS9HWY7_9GAMM|nr:GFA family protein [Lysobacter chinensis]MCF7223411.1 GFA family protein [Lysobacter chinensis]
MSLEGNATTLHGSCHCGSLRVEFSTRLDPAAIGPRACDCSFCRKHGAAYVSDPDGRLRIAVSEAAALLSYRQGSGAARFQLCARCGVLVAVTHEHDRRLFGAVNAGCLDDPVALGAPGTASPQLLGPEEKVGRWLQLWVPDTELLISGT